MPKQPISIVGALQEIASKIPPKLPNLPPRQTGGVWMEEVILVYCVGEGTFSQDMRSINLMMDVYDFTGRWIGYQQGVHLSNTPLPELFAVPPQPTGPWDQPSEVPRQKVQEWTKGLWTFADGSGVYAVGPAQSHLIPFQDGSFLFMVATGQILSGGTGRYEGCAGMKTATGTAFVPPGLLQSGKFPQPGLKFQARTIETFRIAKRQDVAQLPPSGPPQGGAPGGGQGSPSGGAQGGQPGGSSGGPGGGAQAGGGQEGRRPGGPRPGGGAKKRSALPPDLGLAPEFHAVFTGKEERPWLTTTP